MMAMNRRRFLTISAACLVASPGVAATHRWQGLALGADVDITLIAPDEVAGPALDRARALVAKVEQQFSLFDPASALSGLNATGAMAHPDPLFRDIMGHAGRIYAATDGLFDPTMQPLWQAHATGQNIAAARARVGWPKLRFDHSGITLGQGQGLTFNGIAQGFATDLVSDMLVQSGLDQTLVNIGEYRANGGTWRLGLSDPEYGLMGTRVLQRGAIATSSPAAMLLDGTSHIMHPTARPRWSTVSVEAETATTADGFSTALCLAPLSTIRQLVGTHGIRRIALVDLNGDLTTV